MEAWNPEELQAKLEAGTPVFLKVWQKGCGPCKMSEPATRRLEEKNEHELTFGAVCSSDFPEILEITESETLPMFFVFIDGSLRGKHVGFKGFDKLKQFIDEAVAPA